MIWRFSIVVVALVVGAGSAQASVTPIGMLAIPRSAGVVVGDSIAADGGTVVALGGPGGYVFAEPATGWASEGPAAVLIDSSGRLPVAGAPAASGGTAVVAEVGQSDPSGVDVFAEPAGGWSGSVAQAATLVASDGAQLSDPEISGGVVTAAGDGPGPGETAVYVFDEPLGGWSGGDP
jgi:hypothetical protein